MSKGLLTNILDRCIIAILLGEDVENRMDTAQITTEYIKRAAEIDYTVKIPDAEMEVMLAVWKAEPPVNTNYLMKVIGNKKGWKAPTLISFLSRLEDRGFLMSYKNGKERLYIPIADKDTYLSAFTRSFVDTYCEGSFVNMLDSLFHDRKFENEDIDALLTWLKSR